MPLRGIRGATTVSSNSKAKIISATGELISKMVKANAVEISDIASIIFTTTADLNAEFPAVAARKLGWKDLPLLCAGEIDVPGALPLCIRVLMHVNTGRQQKALRHIYLRKAVNLRR